MPEEMPFERKHLTRPQIRFEKIIIVDIIRPTTAS
jgi:hypothetical protein